MKYRVAGVDPNLGAYRTGMHYYLGSFPQKHLKLKIAAKGKKSTIVVVEVKKVIGDALAYIDKNCGKMKTCNDYFRKLSKRSPISLREILDGKRIDVYCLKLNSTAKSKDLPAGYCFSWGADYAQIGLNEKVLHDTKVTASVLLHELAHVAGAPGLRDTSKKSIAAEKSLVYCGMKKYFDPKAIGVIETGRDSRRPPRRLV